MQSVLPDPQQALARAEAYARDGERLAVVHETGLLDAGIQDALQRYVRLAAELTGSPTAALSIIDADRQYFSGAHGFDATESPLDASYCKHTIAENTQLAVEDATTDEVLAGNPATATATEPGVRSYLGSPVEAGGVRIGALCAFDGQARSWDARQRQVVEDLAAALSAEVNLRLALAERSREARCDALTGLGNRRALTAALDDLFAEGRTAWLGLYDLDGFKAYNDAFGHPAGDNLLIRVSGRLAGAVEGRGTAYRMGGDEFCVVADAPEVLEAGREALCERGAGFAIGASAGKVRVPAEAADAASAIGLADGRLYAQKHARPGAVDDQVSSALSVVLAERHERLYGSSAEMAALAARVAEGLGLDEAEVRLVALAARLHDIGMVAIPDAVLTKQEPLDDHDRALLRSHVVIGERILAAAPALAGAAALVRASHERFDGSGYPDGLAGAAIPVGARIVFACETLRSLVEGRPHRAPRSEREALAQLLEGAGTQFDPEVVDAVAAALAAVAPPSGCLKNP